MSRGESESGGLRNRMAANGVDRLRITDGYSAVHKLSDGTATHLRLLRPDDRDRLLEGFANLAEESRYRRFFTPMPELPESVLRRLLEVDGWNHLAIAAESAGDASAVPEPFG